MLVNQLWEARFCHQLCLFITDLQMGFCMPGVVLSWKPSVAAQTKLLFMVTDTVYCQWQVAEGVLGSIGGTSAGRLKFLNFDCLPEN
jgi:hypothetical protein